MRVLPLLLILTACDTASDLRRETDPAVTEALADPIMADPQLALQQEGGASLSVPSGAMPAVAVDAPTLGELATAVVADPAFAKCGAKVDYAYRWMARIPNDLAPPKGAMTVEAAGSDGADCSLRIVRYGSTQDSGDIRGYYAEAARRAGYSTTDKDGAIVGTRAKDGAAFHLITTPIARGSAFDLVVNRSN